MSVAYSDKPWIKRYDPGVPASLNPYPNHSVPHFLQEAARKLPTAPAIVTSAHLPVVGRQKAVLSYADLDRLTDSFGAALIDMGLRRGDRVAMVLPNCAQFVIAFFGILKAGGIVVACNPTYPAVKLQEMIKDSGATFAITLSKFYTMVKDVQAQTDVKHVIVTNIKEYLPGLASFLFTVAKERKEGHHIDKHPVDHALPDLLSKYANKRPTVKLSPDDPAIFQYTGGTTGTPKAAVATHQALVCNTMQCQAFLGTSDMGKEVFMAAIPLFHVFGMISVMCFAISLGASMLMVPNPREIKEVLEVIDAYQPTLFMGVPAMYNAINNNPEVLAGKYNLRSIKACISGSAPLPPATKRKFEELTGGKLVEGYGMSETAVAVTVNPLMGENRTGSIGMPLPDVEIRIVSLDDEYSDVPAGKIGEMVIWAPTLMTGYHNLPTETDNALRIGPDGRKWLHTGDIAYMDEDGYFYIVDRKKDMALIGGYNVYPTNVEKVLAEHPAIQEVGVAAVPHPEKEGQEALKAWVVLKPGHTVTEKELTELASKKLARYEVPSRYEFIQELPKTLVGKVLRRELIALEMQKRGQRTPEKV